MHDKPKKRNAEISTCAKETKNRYKSVKLSQLTEKKSEKFQEIQKYKIFEKGQEIGLDNYGNSRFRKF